MSKPITIVGGGLAGLSLAHGLSKQGIEVTIYEAGHYPRHKVCGEFICGASEKTLQALGLENIMEGAAIVHQAEFKTGRGNCLSRLQLPRSAWGLSRWTLEERLVQRVRAQGGIVLEHQRVNYSHEAHDGIVLCLGRTKTVIGALGLKLHIPNTRKLDKLEMYLGRNAYIGISPIEHNQLNICGLFLDVPRTQEHHRIELMIELCKHTGLDAVADQLIASQPIASSFIGTTHLCFHEKAAAPQSLCIGDAAMAIAPFTGNGMSIALESAACALEPMIHYAQEKTSWEDALKRTQAEYKSRFSKRLWWSQKLHPWILNPDKQKYLQWALRSRLLPLQWLFKRTH